MRLSSTLEQCRLVVPPHYASPRHAPYGAFEVQGPCGARLFIVAADARDTGWEHVSVSTRKRIPNWTEMSFVKNLFWAPEECVVQFHPATSRYVNNYSTVLHLWRYTRGEFPTPPDILVGYKELGELA